jgi:hypothetical protein
MRVSSSSYYGWLKRPPSPREQENQQLIIRLKVLFEKGRGTYGSRRLKRLFMN